MTKKGKKRLNKSGDQGGRGAQTLSAPSQQAHDMGIEGNYAGQTVGARKPEQPVPVTAVGHEQAIMGVPAEAAATPARVTGEGRVNDPTHELSYEVSAGLDAILAADNDQSLAASDSLAVDPGPAATRAGDLRASQDDRIRLSDPSAVPVSKVERPHMASRHKLEQLQTALDSIHGYDAAGHRNTKMAPISDADLRTLRAVVASAVALHDAPLVSRQIIDGLKSLCAIMREFRQVLLEAGKTSTALAGLAAAMGAAITAIQALIEKAVSFLGG